MAAPLEVVALWRYAVKSLQGESLTTAEIGPAGIVGDRAWGIVDAATGFVLTARREPALLLASARCREDGRPPTITLPDGSIAADDDALSRWLGRRVRLESAGADRRATYETVVDFEHEASSAWVDWQGPAGTFHDSTRTQLSIASTWSMRGWDVRRFRQNVIVSLANPDPVHEPVNPPEFALVGQTVSLGGTVDVDVVKRIDRCVMTTRPQPGGIERDLDVLRTINRDHGGDLGVGALIRTPGTVALGDHLMPHDA